MRILSRAAAVRCRARRDARVEETSLSTAAKQNVGRRPALRLRAPSREFFGRYALVFALAALIVVFSLLRPDTFFTSGNFQSILTTEAVLVILALGVILPLAAGEFDLSVAAVLGFSAGLLAHLTANLDWAIAPALLVTLAAALAIGAVNGLFVVRLGVNSFITTLGIGTVVGGLALAIFGAETIGGIPPSFTDPFRHELGGVQMPVFLALALAVAIWFFLEHTPSGRHLF